MIEWAHTQYLLSYHPVLFTELKKIVDTVDYLRESKDPLATLSGWKIDHRILEYLQKQKFNEAVFEVQQHTATLPAFRKRFIVWMNAFRIMKLLNELSTTHFSKVFVFDSATWLWGEISKKQRATNPKSLLAQFRELDRNNSKWLA
jgi:hypothetical protein